MHYLHPGRKLSHLAVTLVVRQVIASIAVAASWPGGCACLDLDLDGDVDCDDFDPPISAQCEAPASVPAMDARVLVTLALLFVLVSGLLLPRNMVRA